MFPLLGDQEYTYHDEHYIIYRIIESLYCAPEHYITIHVNYTSGKKEKRLPLETSLALFLILCRITGTITRLEISYDRSM